MTSIYDRPETIEGVKTGDYAVSLFTWAGDTQTDLRSYFDLTDAEFQAFQQRAEAAEPGSTRTGGPARRPSCDNAACGVELVARVCRTPEQAWCGMWWDHPIIPGQIEQPGIGHTASAVYPAPHERAALASQHYIKAGSRR